MQSEALPPPLENPKKEKNHPKLANYSVIRCGGSFLSESHHIQNIHQKYARIASV